MSNNLKDEAKKASTYSHSPYSKACVGAALLTDDGSVYTGCNIENSSFGGTICAERTAIFKAVSEGHKKLSKIYVYTIDGWPPCGFCLQVMTEFADGDFEVTFGDKNGKEITKKLKDLLTHAFTPKHME